MKCFYVSTQCDDQIVHVELPCNYRQPFIFIIPETKIETIGVMIDGMLVMQGAPCAYAYLAKIKGIPENCSVGGFQVTPIDVTVNGPMQTLGVEIEIAKAGKVKVYVCEKQDAK